MCPYAPRPRHPRTPHRPAFLSDAAPRSGHVGAPRGGRRCMEARGGPAEIGLEAVSRRLSMRRHMSLQTPYSLSPLRRHPPAAHHHSIKQAVLSTGAYHTIRNHRNTEFAPRCHNKEPHNKDSAFKGTARARHVTTRTPPHSFAAAERDAWCIPLRSGTSHTFAASTNGKARTHQIIRGLQRHCESTTRHNTNTSTLVRCR